MAPSMTCLTNSPMRSLAHASLALVPGHAPFFDDLVQEALLFLDGFSLSSLCSRSVALFQP